jgi:signal transduction histidine kinase/DNA-binding NarL/FixJ family response regulator/HPt (histidine-containing phosphotransfer) domain-containing protein
MLSGNDATRRLLSGGRVKLRLILLTLLLVSLLTGLLLLLVSRMFSNLTPSLQDDLRWKAQRGASELSHTGDLGVLTKDTKQLLEVSQRYADERDFLYVAFHNAEGALLFERGDARGLPVLEHSAEKIGESEAAYASWAPMEVEGLPVGDVVLAVSKHRLQASTLLYRRIVQAGLLGALVALALALLFVRLYITPILRLTERTFVELERSVDAALASARARSQFLANMSHEIRTPMNGVFGMVHLVQQTELTATQRRYIDLVAASAKSLLKIVNDVLDFSKLDANKYDLVPEPCELRSMFEQTTNLFEGKASEKRLRLSLTVHKSVPEVAVVDGDRLRQVLSNLLSNAIKFTSAGSVDVQVTAPEAQKASDGSGATQLIKVCVKDTGSGIPEHVRSQLFRAFSQGDGSSNRAHEGTGLGLAISRKLVELMGGFIEHEAPSDGGSIFQFVVPVGLLLQDEGLGRSSAPPSHEPFESARPVLLVDDNEINQLVAVEILESMGLRVDVAGGGREAVEVALAGDYALVLMDCQMPEVDGYQAAREIRQREHGQRLPIIAFTAHALEEERARVMACGMDDYVSKPIEPDVLRKVLARWLRGTPPTSSRWAASAAGGKPSVQAMPAAITSNSTSNSVAAADKPKPQPSKRPGPRLVSKRPEPSESGGTSDVRELAATPEFAALEQELDGLVVLNLEQRRPPRAIQLFVETIPRQLELLRQAASDDRREDVRTMAHKLKGSAGSLGAMQLSKLCDQLQRFAMRMEPGHALRHVSAIERAHAPVHALLESESTAESPPT